jgi:DNA-binding GntR family transcriptional regulator
MSSRSAQAIKEDAAGIAADFPVEALTHSSLGQSVYELLRLSLASGRFRPGAKLRIRELADQLGTSVTPVRDAILQLAREEAIVLRSPRDIRVPELTFEQYLEIRAIRIELEGLAAATAAMRIDDSGLRRMQELLEANRRAVDAGDMATAFQCNQRFHLALADVAGMPCLRGFVDRLWMQTAPVLAAAYESSMQNTRTDDHEEIVSALRNRDSDGARRALRDHLVKGGEAIFRYIRHRENGELHATDDRTPIRLA